LIEEETGYNYQQGRINIVEIMCSEDCESPSWCSSFRLMVAWILASMSFVYVELSIMLCGVATIQSLNSRFRNKNAPTDILTFPQYSHGYDYRSPRMGDHDRKSGYGYTSLGDIVIALPIVMINPSRAHHSELEENLYLAIHGILHIIEFDHAKHAEEGSDCMLMTQKLIFCHAKRHFHDLSITYE